MSDPYPAEQRRFGGDVVAEGVRAPGAPVDPEADARGGGPGTGDVDPGGPSQGPSDSSSVPPNAPPRPDSPRRGGGRAGTGEAVRDRTCPACGAMPSPGGHCECAYTDLDPQNHPRTGG